MCGAEWHHAVRRGASFWFDEPSHQFGAFRHIPGHQLLVGTCYPVISRRQGEVAMRWVELIKSVHQQESGQDALEYALVLAALLVALVAGSESIASELTSGATKLGAKIMSLVQ
jgi:Flp pilus assembly pilin Flp